MGDSIRYPNMGTVAKAAEIYGLSPAYIRRLCKQRKIRYVNAGHRWLVNLDSLARYFEQGDPVDGNQMATNGIPAVNQVTTQHSIAEHNLERSGKKAATTAARTDSDLAQIVQHFQAEIGEFPRSALDKLQRYREAFSTELICKAIDEAAENGVRKWRYVDGILKGWQADGVRTLGDVEGRRESRNKPKGQQEQRWEVLE